VSRSVYASLSLSLVLGFGLILFLFVSFFMVRDGFSFGSRENLSDRKWNGSWGVLGCVFFFFFEKKTTSYNFINQ
jgi:hypothetical protein